MFTGESDISIANTLSEYFVTVSDEFEPLPSVYGLQDEENLNERILRIPTVEEISSKLKTIKKPRSQVNGDIAPELVADNSMSLAVPLAAIYKKVFTSLNWPSLWKTETV